MNPNKLRYIFFLFLLLPLFWVQQTGCAKEYSFEGGDTTAAADTVLIPDSIQAPIIHASSPCSLCKETDVMTTGTWNFKNNQTYFCGGMEDAGFVGTNTTFTFFGPSACSIDTGLVMTVYLPVKFDGDKYDVSASHVAFYYYQHGAKDLFISLSSNPFSLTVQSYSKALGIASGVFNGIVFKPNGDTTYIRDGRFKVKLN